jgi:hypothetical protein
MIGASLGLRFAVLRSQRFKISSNGLFRLVLWRNYKRAHSMMGNQASTFGMLNTKAARLFAALPKPPHCGVGGLDVVTEPSGIEQGIG